MQDRNDICIAIIRHLGLLSQEQLVEFSGLDFGKPAERDPIDYLVEHFRVSPQDAQIVRGLMRDLQGSVSVEQVPTAINQALETVVDATGEAGENRQVDPYATQPMPDAPEDPGPEDTQPIPRGLGADAETINFNSGTRTAPAAGRHPTGLRFRKLRKHAEGGLGTVSVAEDLDFGRQVAIKEIRERYADSSENQAQFVFEAEVTGKLEHPGIVPVYALGRNPDGRPFYAMRFISGEPLDQAIERLHRCEANEQLALRRRLLNRFVSICRTIDYAHDQRVIHRDLKPANIMLGDYGENLVVDWGLAKTLPQSSDQVSDPSVSHSNCDSGIVGTAMYMSPEQARGGADISVRSDVYSLGATLYQLLVGSPPFHDRSFDSAKELIAFVATGPQLPLTGQSIPRPLARICEAAMHPELENRYATAGQLADDLEKYLADEPISVLPETWVMRAGRWARKNRSHAAAVAVAVVCIAIATSLASVITLKAKNEADTLAGQKSLLAKQNQELANQYKDLADQKSRLAKEKGELAESNLALAKRNEATANKNEALAKHNQQLAAQFKAKAEELEALNIKYQQLVEKQEQFDKLLASKNNQLAQTSTTETKELFQKIDEIEQLRNVLPLSSATDQVRRQRLRDNPRVQKFFASVAPGVLDQMIAPLAPAAERTQEPQLGNPFEPQPPAVSREPANPSQPADSAPGASGETARPNPERPRVQSLLRIFERLVPPAPPSSGPADE